MTHDRRKLKRILIAAGLSLVLLGTALWFGLGFTMGHWFQLGATETEADYHTQNTKAVTDNPRIQIQKVDYFNRWLPLKSDYSYTVAENGHNLFYDLMRKFSSQQVTDEVRVQSYSLEDVVNEGNQLFVKFSVWPEAINRTTMESVWGKVLDDGSVRNIYWTINTKTDEEKHVTLLDITKGQPEKITEEASMMVHNESNRQIEYKTDVSKGQLCLTYDGWVNQTIVPYKLDSFFGGEYQGDQQSLIAGSYILTPELTGFLRTEYAEAGSMKTNVYFTYTTDQGGQWQNVKVKDQTAAIRFRKVAFSNDHRFGYLFLSGGRVMGQEGYLAFVTKDGGQTWQERNVAKGVSSLLADGCFINENLGFMSISGVTPSGPPVLYLTNDAGNTWNQGTFSVPEKYQSIFIVAEAPYREGQVLKVKVNQGPMGDYQGGAVKSLFVSEDGGLTWHFDSEVTDAETNNG